jgi:hypothetical protein
MFSAAFLGDDIFEPLFFAGLVSFDNSRFPAFVFRLDNLLQGARGLIGCGVLQRELLGDRGGRLVAALGQTVEPAAEFQVDFVLARGEVPDGAAKGLEKIEGGFYPGLATHSHS